MKKLLIVFFFLLDMGVVLSQLHDNTWIIGYRGLGRQYGLSELTFTDGSLEVDTVKNNGFSYWHNNSAFSDAEGNFVASFNGNNIMNKNYILMDNGGGINKEIVKNYYYLSSESISQGSIMLSWPGRPDSILMFYSSWVLFEAPDGGADIACYGINTVVINTKANNGLGKVVLRDNSFIKDTIQYGRLNAVRHANGRDWWMLISERDSPRFYTILIDQKGPRITGQQTVNHPFRDGVGQCAFSPDGSRFVIFSPVDFKPDGADFAIFDFDRCTGLLSNHHHYIVTGNFGGVAVSPNGRYVYQNVRDTAWRYDLQAADIWASRELIAVYDKFNHPLQTSLYLMQLAPDGKIYCSTTNGNPYLHVIHQPDEADCQYQQHGIKLPKYNGFSVPNFPHYRLGPLDGSPCDTLGLNNDPRAWWRYQQDTLDPLAVVFHDLSYHEPATWQWDFGDGSPVLKGVRHPEHSYPAAGRYEACLTVSNTYGTHTHCKTLYLGVSPTDNPVLQAQVVLSPNPFSDRLTLALSTPSLRRPVLRLYDVAGRLVLSERLEYGINEIPTEGLEKGLYFWAVEAGVRVGDPHERERVKSGKVVKM